MPPFGDGFKADGDMLPVPVCHGGFAVNGIVALGIICPPVRTPAFFSGEGTFQHGTAQKRKGARQFADFLNARYGAGTVELDIKDSYYNMLEKIQPHFHLVENARKAIRAAGLPVEFITPSEYERV